MDRPAPVTSSRTEKSSAGAFGRVLDAVLTFGAEDLQQQDVAALSFSSNSTVSGGRRPKFDLAPFLHGTPVRFTSEMGLVLAVSVGSERIRAGLVDANGVLHCPTSTEARRDQLAESQAQLLHRVRWLAAEVLDKGFRTGGQEDEGLARADGSLPVFAAALALPTPIDRRHRQQNEALKDPSWNSLDKFASLNHAYADALGPLFSHHTAQVMNDCNAASIAVAFDRVRVFEEPRKEKKPTEFRHRCTALVIRVGAAVGCGIIEVAEDQPEIFMSRFLKSRNMVGTHHMAGEIGHLPVSVSAVDNLNEQDRKKFRDLKRIDYRAECDCGQQNHLQALVGGTQFAHRLGIPLDNSDEPLTNLLKPYLDGDVKAANRALEDAGKLLGRALQGAVLALDPKAITVIGALAKPALLDGLREARSDWGTHFFTGEPVEMRDAGPNPEYVIARGAGLALMRQNRHRQFRDIGMGRIAGQLPLLALDPTYLSRLRKRRP